MLLFVWFPSITTHQLLSILPAVPASWTRIVYVFLWQFLPTFINLEAACSTASLLYGKGFNFKRARSQDIIRGTVFNLERAISEDFIYGVGFCLEAHAKASLTLEPNLPRKADQDENKNAATPSYAPSGTRCQ